jgi:predicted permease
MATLLQDLRYAARGLQRTPSFTAAAIITLGLGIGATTGAFSIANAVLLEPLPFVQPDRLIRIQELTPGGEPFSVSEPTFLDFQRTSRSVSQMAAVAPRDLTLTGVDDPVRLQGAVVSHGLFALLGVLPAKGRGFLPEEDRSGAPPVAVLSHQTWRQRFGADPGVVGSSISLDGTGHLVVGVMPEDFGFLPADVWIPLRASVQADPTNHDLDVIARLSDGATIDAARAELQSIAGRLGREDQRQAGWSVQVKPLTEWLVGPAFRRTVWVLLGSVSLLLLIACANVANLLMARAAYRQDEISIRTALGAGRRHIVRQLLVESLVLAAAGGLLGITLSFWIAEALSTLTADLLVVPPAATIDGRVLLFASFLVVVTTIVFGLMPAWSAARRRFVAGGQQGERVTSERRRITEGFVIAQVALAMLLLVASGLMIRSFLRLQDVDTGFVAQDVVAVPLMLPDRQYSSERTQSFFRDLESRLEKIPGIVKVGATSTNPFRQWGFSNNLTPEDRLGEAPPTGLMQAGWRAVTPGFFAALRIPILTGRAFTAADREDHRVVVVSASLARALWPDRDAVGRRLFWGGIDGQPWTVVGVAGDVRDVRVEAPPEPTLYLPHESVPMAGMTVLLRSRLGPGSVAASIRDAISSLDPNLPVPEVRALAGNRDEAVHAPRVRTMLLTVVGSVALLLAAVGLYGLVAFGAAQRVREVGIRIALGARPSDIVRLFLSRGLVLAGVGLAAGLAGAWALARVLESLLFETQPRDPLLFVVAAGVLSSVTAIASYLPARRAAALDPIRVLNRT